MHSLLPWLLKPVVPSEQAEGGCEDGGGEDGGGEDGGGGGRGSEAAAGQGMDA